MCHYNHTLSNDATTMVSKRLQRRLKKKRIQGRREHKARGDREVSEAKNRESLDLSWSPPTTLSGLLFRVEVQFSRHSIRAFNDWIKIRENRGLWTVQRKCTIYIFWFTWYGLRTVVGFKSMLLRNEQIGVSMQKVTKFVMTCFSVMCKILLNTNSLSFRKHCVFFILSLLRC